MVLEQVKFIRKSHPRMGGRKLFYLLKDYLVEYNIKMGRDAFFRLLSDNDLLIRTRRKRYYTTNSHHWFRRWPNLIVGWTPTAPNRLWVSDITYWKIENKVCYISLITDAYSRKVVGYNLSKDLSSLETIKALKMALQSSNLEESGLIHHSDRGVQYCSKEYVKLLQDANIQISMTQDGNPLDNSIAERVNGILKGEYLECYEVSDVKTAKNLLREVVRLYNEQRPHSSISNMVPLLVHQSAQKTEKMWKNYYRKKLTL